MTPTTGLERAVREWLADSARPQVPDWLDEMLAAIDRTPQRPSWTFPGRWLPVTSVTRVLAPMGPVPWRALAVLGLLLLAIVAAIVVAGGRPVRLPSPFGVAGNGTIAFDADAGLELFDPATGKITRIADGGEAVFSLDGSRLAYGISGHRVVVARADGAGATVLPVTIPGGPSGVLQWSVDGRMLLYHHKADGTFHLYDPAGIRPEQTLPVRAATAEGAFRPPDGSQFLVADGGAANGYRLELVSLAGSPLGTVIEVPGGDALSVAGLGRLAPWAWAPDGSRLALSMPTAGPDGARRIIIVNADGTGLRPLIPGADPTLDSEPRWSPDGTRILFARRALDRSGNWVGDGWVIAPLDGGPSVLVRPGLGTDEGGALWSPDGRLVLVDDRSGQWQLIDPAAGRVRRVLEIKPNTVPSWQRLPPP